MLIGESSAITRRSSLASEVSARCAIDQRQLAPDLYVALVGQSPGQTPPDVFVERLGVRGRALLAPEDAAEQRASLDLLHRLAADFVRATPRADVRDLSRHLATVVPDAHGEGPAVETSPAPVGEPLPAGDTTGEGDRANADLNDLDPHGELQATFQLLREEVTTTCSTTSRCLWRVEQRTGRPFAEPVSPDLALTVRAPGGPGRGDVRLGLENWAC